MLSSRDTGGWNVLYVVGPTRRQFGDHSDGPRCAHFRHIDCAAVYGNETEVGAGLSDGMKEAGVKR